MARSIGRAVVGIRVGQAALLVVIVLLGLPPAASPAHAADLILVNSLEDPNPPIGFCPSNCTLRNALLSAQDGDIIHFVVTGTIAITSTLVVDKSVAI